MNERPFRRIHNENKMHHVVIQIPGLHRVPREMTAKLIAENPDVLVFSGRPLFGTTDVDRKHVISIVQVADDTRPMAPRPWRG